MAESVKWKLPPGIAWMGFLGEKEPRKAQKAVRDRES